MIPKFSPRQGLIPYERCREHEAEADALAQLIEIVGADRFQKVQKMFGGQRVWIPKAGAEQPCRRCPDRDRRIQELRHSGSSVVELAERFGLSSKRVYAILNSAPNGNCTASVTTLSYVK